LKTVPRALRHLSTLERLDLRDNPTLAYPPYAEIQHDIFDNCKDLVFAYLTKHEDTISHRGRREALWPSLVLMYIAQTDKNCEQTFGKLPAEVIKRIESFALGDPYLSLPKKVDTICNTM